MESGFVLRLFANMTMKAIAVSSVNNKLHGADLYHSVCRNCGSVLRSYVKDPEKLLKKKDRRDKDEMF